ncbi:MAG: DUF6055 domain-containing protein [Gammaproteobacteria bacterium]
MPPLGTDKSISDLDLDTTPISEPSPPPALIEQPAPEIPENIPSSSALTPDTLVQPVEESALENIYKKGKDYCAAKQNPDPNTGQFAVLRPESSDTLHESDHFVLRWKDDSNVVMSDQEIQNTLSTLEDSWDFYIGTLGFQTPYHDTTEKYKVSVNVSDQGWASGSGTGTRDPEMWIHYNAARDIGVIAHELAHTFQFTTLGMRDSGFVGWMWESHAEWMRHQKFPEEVGCSETLVNAPHIHYGSTRDRYCNWQFLEFIKDQTCTTFVNDNLWINAPKASDSNYTQADPFSVIAKNADWNTAELNDVFADWVRHNLSWDYNNGDVYRSRYGSYEDNSGIRRYRLTQLEAVESIRSLPAAENTFGVPDYWAPQRWGYNVVKLIPAENTNLIRVKFEGQVQLEPAISTYEADYALQPDTILPPESGWRWSVVVIDGNGNPRYSPIQRSTQGMLEVSLEATDQNVWLFVMATPNQVQKFFWDQVYYSIYRYPWTVTLEGAMPEGFSPTITDGIAGGPHVNGGGFVASTATVAPTAYVGPQARVLGTAQVLENARIEDRAVVDGSALVITNAVIRDRARITGSARVDASAVVEDNALIINGHLTMSALVGGITIVDHPDAVITDSAIVKSSYIEPIRNYVIGGTAQLYGDIDLQASVNQGVYYDFVLADFVGNPAYGSNRTAPANEITADLPYKFIEN